MIRKNNFNDNANSTRLQKQGSTESNGIEKANNRHELLIKLQKNSNKISLDHIMKCFEEANIQVQFIEIKHPEEQVKNKETEKVYVQCQCSFEELLQLEQKITENHRACVKHLSQPEPVPTSMHDVPWFPRNASDLDQCQHLQEKQVNVITADHPGFCDAEYVKRRQEIATLALNYRHGDVIPDAQYSDEEIQTWKMIYTTLKPLHAKAACYQYIDCVRELEKSGLYSPDEIPSLEMVSKHLKDQSGFSLRPVAGLVSARDFLASLAVKVFQCTQYIRHSKSLMHTPEPDCCHELLGHVPMLCNPEFANFSQEIGILSLGASDEDIEKLATLYWFTVEFGLCRQNGVIKAYGAGILSAYGEMEHALSGRPELCEFDPEKASSQSYQDAEYQPLYFVANSFADALTKVREFAGKTIKKPFNARYNATTGSVDIFRKNNPYDIARAAQELKNNIHLLRGLVE